MVVSLPPYGRRGFSSRISAPLIPIALSLGLSLVIPVGAPRAWAQDAPAPQTAAPQPPKLRYLLTLLREVNYDPMERGPLLVVGPSAFLPPNVSLPEGRTSLTAVANALNLRLFPVGQMNVLAGRMMAALNANPGKANPFAGLKSGELFKVMLASFTKDQWQQVGSPNGIGKGNLTDEQRLIWDSIFSGRMRIQTSTLKAGATPNSFDYVDTAFTDLPNGDNLRLRISKKVTFSFSKVGAEDYSWGGEPYFWGREAGAKEYYLQSIKDQPNGSTVYRGDLGADNDALPNSAFGVQLVSEQPRRLKTGAIDFAAQALNVPVSLADFPAPPDTEKKPIPPNIPAANQAYLQMKAELAELPTVGAILGRISQATGIEFIADRRVRDLPVFLRGNSARAGDLLQALALGVAGAFRNVEPGNAVGIGTTGKQDNAPLYLLTDDIQGIGTRVAQLSQWGQDADETKRKMMDGVGEKTAKSNPLDYISFAPGDKFALPEAQNKALESGWRKEKYASAPAIKWNDLTPALRTGVQSFVDERQENGVSLRTDRVRVGTELQAYIIVPEISAAIPSQDLSWGIGHQYIQEIAYTPTAAANKPTAEGEKKPTPAPALGFASPTLKGQRRVLIARPADAADAIALVRAAASRGITDLWLEVSLKDPEVAVKLLTAATKAGAGKVAVGGVVRLLKGGGLNGEAERNIYGETGEAFKTRLLAHYASHEHSDWYQDAFDGYTGWIIPDPADMVRRVKRIAAVPGLAGLTIRASGAPGWTGLKSGGDGIWANADLGYTPTMRRAFLREKGIDPIDLVNPGWTLSGVRWDVGYFAANDGQGDYTTVNNRSVRRTDDGVPQGSWWVYRKSLNDALLSNLFQAIKKDKPNLALYLANPVSGYASPNTNWFASWDAADKIPESDPYVVESEARNGARRSSKLVLAHWGWWWNETEAKKPEAPANFARQVTDAALRNPPPNWDGIVLDMTGIPCSQLTRLLGGLPVAP